MIRLEGEKNHEATVANEGKAGIVYNPNISWIATWPRLKAMMN